MKESQTSKSSGISGLVPDPEILNADLEGFLELEMEEQIGYPKHAP